MNEFLEYLIKSIVSKPEEVKIAETQEGEFYTYIISVAQEDMGTVIGKEGKNIKGIRNIAKAKAIKDGVRIRIDLEDKPKPGEESLHEKTPQVEEVQEEKTSDPEAGTKDVED